MEAELRELRLRQGGQGRTVDQRQPGSIDRTIGWAQRFRRVCLPRTGSRHRAVAESIAVSQTILASRRPAERPCLLCAEGR